MIISATLIGLADFKSILTMMKKQYLPRSIFNRFKYIGHGNIDVFSCDRGVVEKSL